MTNNQNRGTRTYKWAKGSCIRAPAQKVGPRIDKLMKTCGGRLTPAALVDAATSDPVLHELFTWDNTMAAEKYRELEAAKVLRSLQVKFIRYYPNEDNEPVVARNSRVAVNVAIEDPVTGDRSRVYVPLLDAMNNRELMQQVIDAAARDLRAWSDKYSLYVDLGRETTRIYQLGLTRLKACQRRLKRRPGQGGGKRDKGPRGGK